MATTPNFDRRISDRPLYLLAAVVIPLIVLAGFARTYYLKGVFATPALPSLIAVKIYVWAARPVLITATALHKASGTSWNCFAQDHAEGVGKV